jgi:uncharacterized protein (UPF0333 family)
MKVHAGLTPNTKVQRESRKFPRVQLPLEVKFEDSSYRLLDCSVNGIGVAGLPGKVVVGETTDLKIYFPAHEGKVRLDIKARLVWIDKVAKRSGWLFIGIRPDQKKLISELTLLYASGQLEESEGQVLTMKPEIKSAVAGKLQASPAQVSSSFGIRRVVGLCLFALLGVLAAAFLFKLIYSKLFVIEAASASIFSVVTSVASPFEGTLTEVQSKGHVKANDVVAKITQPSGTVSDIKSPCDCEVISAVDRSGSYVGLGQVVAVLVRSDTTPTVSVRIPFSDLDRVVKGANVRLTYLDGRTVKSAKVVGFPKVSDEASAIVTLFVEAGLDLKPSQVGEPVYAQIDLAPW